MRLMGKVPSPVRSAKLGTVENYFTVGGTFSPTHLNVVTFWLLYFLRN
jgi:hypothetical protein